MSTQGIQSDEDVEGLLSIEKCDHQKFASAVWRLETFIDKKGVKRLLVGLDNLLQVFRINDSDYSVTNKKDLVIFNGYYNCFEYHCHEDREYIIFENSNGILYSVDLLDQSTSAIWNVYRSYCGTVVFIRLENGTFVVVSTSARLDILDIDKHFKNSTRTKFPVDPRNKFTSKLQLKVSDIPLLLSKFDFGDEIRIEKLAYCSRYKTFVCTGQKQKVNTALIQITDPLNPVMNSLTNSVSYSTSVNTFSFRDRDFFSLGDVLGNIQIWEILSPGEAVPLRNFKNERPINPSNNSEEIIAITCVTNYLFCLSLSPVTIYNIEDIITSEKELQQSKEEVERKVKSIKTINNISGEIYCGTKGLYRGLGRGERVREGWEDEDEKERRIYVLENFEEKYQYKRIKICDLEMKIPMWYLCLM